MMDGSRWRGTTAACRILAIDDDPAILSLTARALSPAGFTVALAGTGSQGLAIALQQPFDLVLLDLGLPDLGGEEVLRRLLRDHPRQAVLIWSATTDRQALNRCRTLGASGYLRKPFTLTELMRSIAAHCPSRRDPDTGAGSRQTQRR
jgi:DNA-binding response OmpR family regulator